VIAGDEAGAFGSLGYCKQIHALGVRAITPVMRRSWDDEIHQDKTYFIQRHIPMILTFPGQEYIVNSVEVVAEANLMGPRQRPLILTYRGQDYEAMQMEAIPATSGYIGMYRGNRCNISNTQLAPQANVMLTYRGVPYRR
jgi:hypothetical protein